MKSKLDHILIFRAIALITVCSAFLCLSAVASASETAGSAAKMQALPMYSPEVTDVQLKDAITLTPRPFVLINERELNALRMTLAKEGWKRDIYQHSTQPGRDEYSGLGLLCVANRWLKTDVSIPKYGGHGHHFYCDCGTQLTLPADTEPKPSYTCPACGKTFSGEKYDAAVRCFRHHQLANTAEILAIVYGIEHNRAYSDKAAEILRKYAHVYPGPHTSATAGGIIFQSLNEAMWAIPLAQAYDLIYDSGSLTDDDKRLIEEKLFRPVAKGLVKSGTGGNWGSWHFCAVGVIGFAIRDQAMVRYAIANFKNQILNYLGDDGLWPESVHTYHFFVVTTFTYFAEACYRASIDLYNWEARPGKSFKAMFLAPLQYVYPSFQLPTINDGWWHSPLPLNLYEIARLRWDDPIFEWAVNAGYERENASRSGEESDLAYLGGMLVYRFLFGHTFQPVPDLSSISVAGTPTAKADAATGSAKVEHLQSTDFPKFGLCTLRNGEDPMLTFHYGRYLGHGHLDKMSFTFFANGSLLIPDYGTPGYGSKILHWYQGTAGHNTVEVDGKNQARSKESNLTAFYSGTFAQFTEANATDIYPGVTHKRSMLLLGNSCFISDDLHSEEEHDYDWLVRCQGQPEVIGEYSPAKINTDCYPPAKFDRKECFSDAYRLNWKCRGSDLAFGMWTGSNGGDVALGKCPGETDIHRASFFVCRRHARDARFLAVLAPSKPGENVKLTRSGSTVEVHTAVGIDYTYIKGIFPEDASAELTTDAQAAAVRTAKDAVAGLVLVRGAQLEWKGETLLQCPSGLEFVEVSFDGDRVSLTCSGHAEGTIRLKTDSRTVLLNGQPVTPAHSGGCALIPVKS